MHPPTRLEEELRKRSQIQGEGYTEEVTYIGGPRDQMFASVTLPADREPVAGIVVCPSVFELATLQPTELRFLRRAAVDGFAGIYVQPLGAGESSGSPGETRVTDRIEAARNGHQHLLRSVPGIPICYFGARFGAAVATRAAESVDSAALIVWDPVFEVSGYLKQIRRLARISAVAGGANTLADPLKRLSERGHASILGTETTATQIEDLVSAEPDVPEISGPVLVIAFSGRSASVATKHLGNSKDLQIVELEKGDLGGLGMSVREAPQAFGPTLAWMSRKFR